MAVYAAVSVVSKDPFGPPRELAWFNNRLRFVETYKKQQDFDQIWLGLCRDDPEVKVVIRSYFRDFVEASYTARPVLGEQEYEVVQTITATKTVIEHWKNLVLEADNTILRLMRREEPHNRGLWKLRWDQGEPSDRPVADISKVSRADSATSGLGRT